MAIKIKKKDVSKAPEVEVLDVDGEEIEAEVDVFAGNVDPFERATMSGANWIEKNRMLVLGAIVLFFAALIGWYFFSQNKKAEAIASSTQMNSVFDDFLSPVKGSAELEALTSNPNAPTPNKTFDDETKKWTAIFEASKMGVSDTRIVQSARLAKAPAAARLNKLEKATAAYDAFLTGDFDPSAEGPVLSGLASVQVSGKKYEDALKTLTKLQGVSPSYEGAAKYRRARIFEWQKKVEDAKKLYHDILENHPNFPQRSDIERRLALL